MQSTRRIFTVGVFLMGLLYFTGLQTVVAQTGYAVKKPIIGGACSTCPWGAMSEVVKTAMQPYGWDIQICYYCAGGPREARMVAGAMMATPPANPKPDDMPTPVGPIDFGVTGAAVLKAAYLGENDFAEDPEGPRTQLRAVAFIQSPAYYIVAVKSNLGISDLAEIAQKRIPVKIMASAVGQRQLTPAVLEYYGLSKEVVESFGGTFDTHYSRDADFDVMLGFGSLTNAPEFTHWYHATQKYDFKYLELASELREQLNRLFYAEEQTMPLGYFRGVDKPVTTVVQNGIVIYGRVDMPDDFAYTLAKAMDEHQDLLVWRHMHWSYNRRTVWNAPGLPLHPGAERYYKEKGYLK
jgi:uncharacterized protein